MNRIACKILFACIILTSLLQYGYAADSPGATLNAGSSSGLVYGWKPQILPGSASWSAIALSSSGAKIVGTRTGGGIPVCTSADSGVTWEPSMASSDSFGAVASSSDGTRLITVGGGYVYTSANSGTTWTQTNLHNGSWAAVASSSDGTKLVAVENQGYIYTSSNSGTTWTQQTNSGSRPWVTVASSSDGTRLVAAAKQGYIYTSGNSGSTWVQQTSAGLNAWSAVASSSDGSRIVAVPSQGYISTSANYGATWTQRTVVGTKLWQAVASSSDGRRLVATESPGYIYTSTDYGATWTQRTSSGNRSWGPVASTADGTEIVAAESWGFIYTSPDSGTSWVQQQSPSSPKGMAVASSANKNRFVAAESGSYIYMSNNSGADWIQRTSAGIGAWNSVVSSADGTKLFAAEGNGYIFKSTDSGTTWTQTNSGSRNWSTLAASSDGIRLIAAETGGFVHISTDSGANWNQQLGYGNWTAVASSADGTRLFAARGSSVYISTDSGANWRSWSPGNGNISAVASSSDGAGLIAAESSGYLYTSTNFGVSWTQRTTAGNRSWAAVASSSDGQILVAAASEGYIFISGDYGETWTKQTSAGSRNWYSLWLSLDGTKILAGSEMLFIGFDSIKAPTLDSPTASSIAANSAKLGATIQSDGNAPITAAGIAYGLEPDPDTTGKKVSSGTKFGTFTVNVTGLTSNTLYYYRGYATNSKGTGYTDDETFTTLAKAPELGDATGVGTDGFTANWTAPTGTATITGYRLDVASDSNFTSFISGYQDLPVAGLSQAVSGLASGTAYYYRVRAVNAGGTSSNSGTKLVVTAGPPAPTSITITSPGGGTSWKAGTKQAITWTYTGEPGPKVKISLLKSGSLVAVLTQNASIGKSGAGSYAWNIKSTLKGNDYQIQVASTKDSSSSGVSSNFTIEGPTITLVAPGGGENWTSGTKQRISWTYTGSPGNVKLELLKGGNAYAIIKSSTSAGRNSAGSYVWAIPKALATGAYQVRVTAIASSECTSTSNGFNIVGPTITLNPIQNSTAGSKLAISWSYTGSPGKVKIELLQGGSPISTIKASTSAGKNNAGSYTWAIPKTQAAGNNYEIRVTAIADSTCGDTSPDFSIASLAASAGPDQQAKASAVVNLSALNSTGVTENSASYKWTQTAGPKVELSDPNASEAVFLAPESDADGESLGFQLTVTNGEGVNSEDSCIVNVSESNPAPIAEAGPNQVVLAAQIVELDGSRSSASGSIVAGSWRQISGSPVVLTDASAMQTTFVAPDVNGAGESLVFELTVTDQAGLRSRDTCVVNVIWQNQPPVANAGQNQTVRPGTRVVLDGTGSFDGDGAIASCRWKQLSGKPVVLSNPTAVAPSFVAPVVEDGAGDDVLVFQLFVTDAGGLQGAAKTTVFVKSNPSGKK